MNLSDATDDGVGACTHLHAVHAPSLLVVIAAERVGIHKGEEGNMSVWRAAHRTESPKRERRM